MMILKRNYSFKRIFRKIIFFLASKTPFIPGKYRALLFYWGGVKFDNPLSCFLGSNVYFDDLHPELISVGSDTIITEGTRILSHFLDVSYDDFDHQDCEKVSRGSKVFIGMNSVIVKPVVIGDGAIIGANSVINKSIPSYTIWGGNPAKLIMNRIINNK